MFSFNCEIRWYINQYCKKVGNFHFKVTPLSYKGTLRTFKRLLYENVPSLQRRVLFIKHTFSNLLFATWIKESNGFVKIFDFRFLTDLQVLEWNEHVMTISECKSVSLCVCVCVCVWQKFCWNCSSKTNRQNLMKLYI